LYPRLKNARMEPPLYSCALSFSMAAYAGQPHMPGMTDPDLELAIRVMIDRGATDEEMIAATKDAITHMRALLGKPGVNPSTHKLRHQRAELARAFGRPSPHMQKRSSGRRTAILGIAGATHKEALFDLVSWLRAMTPHTTQALSRSAPLQGQSPQRPQAGREISGAVQSRKRRSE
jgi:hypothetical protein